MIKTIGTRNQIKNQYMKHLNYVEGILPGCISQPLNPQAEIAVVISKGFLFKSYFNAPDLHPRNFLFTSLLQGLQPNSAREPPSPAHLGEQGTKREAQAEAQHLDSPLFLRAPPQPLGQARAGRGKPAGRGGSADGGGGAGHRTSPRTGLPVHAGARRCLREPQNGEKEE